MSLSRVPSTGGLYGRRDTEIGSIVRPVLYDTGGVRGVRGVRGIQTTKSKTDNCASEPSASTIEEEAYLPV
jgi:hypothetical protein